MRGAKTNVTPAAKKLLGVIRRMAADGRVVTQGELCRRTKRTKGSVSLLLLRLESAGLIARDEFEAGKARRIEVK